MNFHNRESVNFIYNLKIKNLTLIKIKLILKNNKKTKKNQYFLIISQFILLRNITQLLLEKKSKFKYTKK